MIIQNPNEPIKINNMADTQFVGSVPTPFPMRCHRGEMEGDLKCAGICRIITLQIQKHPPVPFAVTVTVTEAPQLTRNSLSKTMVGLGI